MSGIQKTGGTLSESPKASSIPELPSGNSDSAGTQLAQATKLTSGPKKHTGKGEKQEKSGTMYLNELHQKKGENNTVSYDEYKCEGFAEYKPLYGCKCIVNGVLVGQSENHPNILDARKAAADEAAKALGLVKQES